MLLEYSTWIEHVSQYLPNKTSEVDRKVFFREKIWSSFLVHQILQHLRSCGRYCDQFSLSAYCCLFEFQLRHDSPQRYLLRQSNFLQSGPQSSMYYFFYLLVIWTVSLIRRFRLNCQFWRICKWVVSSRCFWASFWTSLSLCYSSFQCCWSIPCWWWMLIRWPSNWAWCAWLVWNWFWKSRFAIPSSHC